MYFFQELILSSLLKTALQIGAFSAGGCLLVLACTELPVKDRILPGISLGMVLFIVVSNLTARFLPFDLAFPTAAGVILFAGVITAWRKRSSIQRKPAIADEAANLVVFAALLLLFILMNRGLAILDDYHNLPLISIMATGQVPPPFYLKTDTPISYHYGLHLFATFLVSQGKFFPWSAYDLGKALAIALTICTARTWFRWNKLEKGALLFSVFIFALAGGTRWLLLLAPESWLQHASAQLNLLGSGHSTGIWLTENLTSTWNIEGDGPFPFPFAFANGIFHPLIFSLGSNSTLPILALILLLLMQPLKWSFPDIVVYSLCFASLGLTAELWVVAVGLGMIILVPVLVLRRVPMSSWRSWAAALLLSIPLFAFQGGVISGFFATGFTVPSGEVPYTDCGTFHFQFPPAVISTHLGELSLTGFGTMMIAAAEIGPVLLLLAFTPVLIQKAGRERKYFTVAVLAGSLAISLLSLFMHYSVLRDTARIIGSSCYLWLLLFLPELLDAGKTSRLYRKVVIRAIALSTLGGVVFASIMLIAIKSPQQSYFITGPDAQIASEYWNKLEEDAWIFDPLPHRAATIFGRIADAKINPYKFLDSYLDLLENPTPEKVSRAGFDYYYLDEIAWQQFSNEEQQAFQDECVYSVEAIEDSLGNLRILYDITACR